MQLLLTEIARSRNSLAMDDKQLIAKFRRYVSYVGEATAMAALIQRDVSPRTADKLVGRFGEDYACKPRTKVRRALVEITRGLRAS